MKPKPDVLSAVAGQPISAFCICPARCITSTTKEEQMPDEARQLERAVAGLWEGSSPRRRPGRPRERSTSPASTPTKASGRAGRAPRGQRREELLAAIKATPGARPSDLARTIGIKPAQVHALIAKARAEKLIAKEGKGYALKA